MSISFIHDKRQYPLVWYASYGSNMDTERFTCYIRGGTPSGASRNYAGCDDKSMPIAETSIELPYSLYFAGESSVWTGGAALINNTVSKHRTKSKAYLITKAQFEQVVAQESRRNHVVPMDIVQLRRHGRLINGDGNGQYDQILYCGEYKRYPVVTCTSSWLKLPYTRPSHAYLKTIISGLQSGHNLSKDDILQYLRNKPGISGNYSSAELSDVILQSLSQSIAT